MTEEKSKTSWFLGRLLKPRSLLVSLLVLVALGLIIYGFSLYNSQKFFLIVEQTHVRVAKGRFLPFGRRPFIPREESLRAAYRTVPLISGMKSPVESATFTDRIELDQALFRLLKAATELGLTKNDARSGELTAKYLAQLDALPGLSAAQKDVVTQLHRDAEYIQGQALLKAAIVQLKAAQKKFGHVGAGGQQFQDGAQQAARIRRALAILQQTQDLSTTEVPALEQIPSEPSFIPLETKNENPIAPESPATVIKRAPAQPDLMPVEAIERAQTSSTSTIP